MFEWNPDWASAIASIESAGSGNYGAVGPLTSKGNRAYGRYQVMDFNIPNWTRKYVGREMTPDEFLADPKAQDLVFQGEFGSYVQRYGNPQDAASMWFTGRPASQGAGASDILGTTGSDYVSKFNAALGDRGVIASGIGNDALVALGRAPTTRTEAPMGLLNMGQQSPQQAEQQGSGFWNNFAGGILADPDRRARLAMALEGMTLRPNEGVISAAQSGIEGRKTQATLNKTIEWLRGQPNGEAYIRMIEAGASPAQVIQALMGERQALANPNVQSVQALPDGGAVYYMKDGSIVVRDVSGNKLTGDAAQQYVRDAQAYGADLQRSIYAGRETGKAEGAAAAQLPSAAIDVQYINNIIDDILKDPALSSMVGPIEGRLPNISGSAQRFQSKLDQLSGQAFLSARQALKGGGAITDFESQKAEAAYLRMNTSQSEEDFIKALNDFRDAVQSGYAKLQASSGVAQPQGVDSAAPTQNDDPLGIR